MCPLAANRDELDRFQFSMRRRAAEICKLQPAQYRPARRIQTITTDFFAREFFPLDNECAQSGGRAECGTCRSTRPGSHDCDIEEFHLDSVSERSL